MAEVEFSLGKYRVLAPVVKRENLNLAAFKKREGKKRATSKWIWIYFQLHFFSEPFIASQAWMYF